MVSLKKIARKAGLGSPYHRIAAWIAMFGSAPNPPEGGALIEDFKKRAARLASPSVLELGTKRSIPNRSTKHDDWIPNAREHLGTDIAAGLDVDIVADIHRLSEVVGIERFDIIISCSSFEHFKYPHLAAHEIMKALRIGGLLFVQTHQTFPLHAFPYDYFRFSREAMSSLFGSRMGFRVIGTAYEFPARIYSRQEPTTRRFEAYLNVLLYGEKTGATPNAYVYELD